MLGALALAGIGVLTLFGLVAFSGAKKGAPKAPGLPQYGGSYPQQPQPQAQPPDVPNPAIFDVAPNGVVGFKPVTGPPMFNSLAAYAATPVNGNDNVVKLWPVLSYPPGSLQGVAWNAQHWAIWKLKQGYAILAARILAAPIEDPLNQKGESLKSLIAAPDDATVRANASLGQWHAFLMKDPNPAPAGQYVQPPPYYGQLPAAGSPYMAIPIPAPLGGQGGPVAPGQGYPPSYPQGPQQGPFPPQQSGPPGSVPIPVPVPVPGQPSPPDEPDDGFDADLPDELRELATQAIDSGDPDRIEAVANELAKTKAYKLTVATLREKAKTMRAAKNIENTLTRVVWQVKEGHLPSQWAAYAQSVTGNPADWRELINPDNPTLKVVNVKKGDKVIRTEVRASRNGVLGSWVGTQVILPKSWGVPMGTQPPPPMAGVQQTEQKKAPPAAPQPNDWRPPMAVPNTPPAAPAPAPKPQEPVAQSVPVVPPGYVLSEEEKEARRLDAEAADIRKKYQGGQGGANSSGLGLSELLRQAEDNING